MKKMKLAVFGMSLLTIVSCGSAAGNGTLIGSGAGSVLGAVAGKLIGGSTKSTVVGAAVGTAVGATAGNLIGRHMDKVKAQAQAAAANATVENVVDINGLPAVRVTFDSGILFATGKYNLNSAAQSELAKFSSVLKSNTDCEVAVLGYTDNDKWKNSTAEQSVQKNLQLSQQRAQSVSTYMTSQGVSANQIKTVQGYGEENPIADNSTAEGKALNRRVEVYLYASQAMIDAANAGTLN